MTATLVESVFLCWDSSWDFDERVFGVPQKADVPQMVIG